MGKSWIENIDFTEKIREEFEELVKMRQNASRSSEEILQCRQGSYLLRSQVPQKLALQSGQMLQTLSDNCYNDSPPPRNFVSWYARSAEVISSS